MDEITCEEFLALDPDGQQRTAYTLWQKLKKHL